MKSFAYGLIVILAATAAAAAPSKKGRRAQVPVIEKLPDPRMESTATLSESLPNEARTTVYKSSVRTMYGTIVNDNNYATGDRINALELRPSLEIATKSSGDYAFEMPMTWATNQGKQEFRIIGRPDLSAMFEVSETADSRTRAGLAVKLPLVDTSTGQAELWRVWQIAPRFDHDSRMGDSQYRFQFSARATYDTAAKVRSTYESQWGRDEGDTTWERGSTLGGRFGIAREAGTNLYGAGINLKYGIGQNHIASKSKYTSTSGGNSYESDWRGEFNPMEMSWLDVYGKFDLGDGTALLTSLQKTIRYELNLATAFASYDELAALSSLGVSLGLSKSF